MLTKLPVNISGLRASFHHSFHQANLHLLEAPHTVQNVELLPAFGEIDLPVYEVRVPQVDKGQVLKN